LRLGPGVDGGPAEPPLAPDLERRDLLPLGENVDRLLGDLEERGDLGEGRDLVVDQRLLPRRVEGNIR